MNTPPRIRTEDTWAQAREDYLAGDTGRVVCERYDLCESAFNKRAREEGWRRRDQSDPEAVVEDPPPPPRPFIDSVMEALGHADRALRRGKAAEAQRFLVLAEKYELLAWLEEDRMETASIQVRREQRDTEARAAARAALVQKVQNVQSPGVTRTETGSPTKPPHPHPPPRPN